MSVIPIKCSLMPRLLCIVNNAGWHDRVVRLVRRCQTLGCQNRVADDVNRLRPSRCQRSDLWPRRLENRRMIITHSSNRELFTSLQVKAALTQQIELQTVPDSGGWTGKSSCLFYLKTRELLAMLKSSHNGTVPALIAHDYCLFIYLFR